MTDNLLTQGKDYLKGIPEAVKKVDELRDTQKPPMVVWLEKKFERRFTLACVEKESGPEHCNAGPYVHLDQFVEAVEERANIIDHGGWEPGEAEYQSMQELVKELKEQS